MLNFKKVYPRHTVPFDSKLLWLTVESLFKCGFLDKAKIAEFERTFANSVGTETAIAAPSGRIALYLILQAYQYPLGSEIILSDYNFPPLVSVIIQHGLKPVFTDINPETFNIDTEKIEQKISSKTKAILATHMFGNPCDMDAINNISGKYGLQIIEDATHAFGSEWHKQKAGDLGNAAFFSLSQGKNIASFGGGVITLSDKITSAKIRELLNNFSDARPFVLLKRILKTIAVYQSTKSPLFNILVYPLLKGFNYSIWNILEHKGIEDIHFDWKRMDSENFSDLQAVVGLYQLSKTALYKENKERIINQLDRGLNNYSLLSIQQTLPYAQNYKLYYAVTLKNKTKDAVINIRRNLLNKGVDTQFLDIHACSLIKAFNDYACDCPNSARIAPATFEIPSHISLNSRDINKIIEAIKQCVK